MRLTLIMLLVGSSPLLGQTPSTLRCTLEVLIMADWIDGELVVTEDRSPPYLELTIDLDRSAGTARVVGQLNANTAQIVRDTGSNVRLVGQAPSEITTYSIFFDPEARIVVSRQVWYSWLSDPASRTSHGRCEVLAEEEFISGGQS